MRFESDFDIPYGHKEDLWTLDITGMSSLRPDINKDTCNECGTCYLYCPTGSILFNENGINIIHKYCKGCGICVKECPVKALSMVEIRED
jgi:pyruvate ferredoxin oxidoreductase delta subunit